MAGGPVEPIGAHTPAERLSRPILRFANLESSSGIVLIACTLVAMVWANSPWAESYFETWHTHFAVSFGDWSIDKELHHWINDGLMAIFFFVVGLEIKREMVVGQLNTFRKAALPMMAAIGGMAVPAIIFAAFNIGQPSIRGWGVPMATDIAFALGILGILGSRVPVALKVFLTALAIVDDIGAVAVVAIFYTEEINMFALVTSGILFASMFVLNKMKVRSSLPYFIIGAILWYFVLASGVHATVAGILVAFAIPTWPRIKPTDLRKRGEELLARVPEEASPFDPAPQEAVSEMAVRLKQADPPLTRLERSLHPWVAFGIMPIFALANAGVPIPTDPATWTSPIMLGVAIALVVGNFVGITGLTWLSCKLGIAELPTGITLSKIAATALLAGVGFTMSLFIANLAFEETARLNQAKLGVIVGSTIAAILGLSVLAYATRKPKMPGPDTKPA